jgi:glycosyltransferase involved in cell wall biosynthesis
VKVVPLQLRVAVVIPCRDDAEYLRPCLEALAAQTHPADRVIVVDNMSSDDSAAVARAFGAEVVSEPLLGIWPAASRGYDEAMASADVIARLDADSRPHPDWIARLVRAFVAEPELGVLTGGSEFYGASTTVNYLGDHWYIGGGNYWVQKWLGQPLVFGSNFAMRARVWQRVRELVDRTNPKIHDDLDLTIRLRPSDGVRYDPELRMPVSARPLVTQRGLWRRVWRVVPTFAASWPEGAAWRRRAEGRAAIESAPAAAASAAPTWEPDTEWTVDGEDWTPEFGR